MVIAVALIVAQLLRFGPDANAEIGIGFGVGVDARYSVLGLLIGLAWWTCLSAWNARDIKIVGVGSEEYKRVTVSSLYVFGAIAIVSYAANIPTARGYVGVALPVGLSLLLISRFVYRRIVVGRRRDGKYTRRLLLVGGPSAVAHLHKNLSGAPAAGYTPVAAFLPGFARQSPTGDELAVPVAGVGHTLADILLAIEAYKVDAIAISSGSSLKPRVIRQLGWELHARGISMIMAPALTDVAGPRIHTVPVAGLPLIHVTTPKLEGLKGLGKRAFDIAGSVLGIIVLSPVLLALTIAVVLDSPGPAFFHQDRVGKNGSLFRMHKFRSMVVDAEARLNELAKASEGNGVLFKMKGDPRITKLGAFIRKYSLDELPQLWNVLVGEMSIVGPRPPLPAEVETYEQYVHRRLLVQPGITGLWQVSGRSDLSWEDSVRLDLYYVENWSLMQDLVILFRTVKAVVAKDGAY